MPDALDLARQLIARRSVTPEDAGCQDLLAERLERAGFQCERLPFGEVSNLWATRGTGGPLLVFAGHTDVVPPGPLEDWRTDPFDPVVKDQRLYGRGAADMKGGLAAMVVAAERFAAAHPDHGGSIGFLLTSDEEGRARDGTRHVMEVLHERAIKIDCCLVGEPSSAKRVADTVRRGRRGSLTGCLTVKGKQGHVAYPRLADNPLHRALPLLAKLANARWDQGYEGFPPTSLQVVNIQAGTGADNVIPGTLEVQFNFRYSPAVNAEELQGRVERLLDRHKIQYELRWRDSGAPFFTGDGALLQTVTDSVMEITGNAPELSTAGGTSDGRFIAPYGVDVVELGAVNASIHQVNECVDVEDLEVLVRIYRRILERLLQSH